MTNAIALIIVLLLAAMWWDLRDELRANTRKGIQMDRTLDDLKAEVGQVDNLVTAVSTFISGLQGQINAMPELSPAAQTKVNSLFDQVQADITGFTKAIAAGTPAAPVVDSHAVDATTVTTPAPADTIAGSAAPDATASQAGGTFSDAAVSTDQTADSKSAT